MKHKGKEKGNSSDSENSDSSLEEHIVKRKKKTVKQAAKKSKQNLVRKPNNDKKQKRKNYSSENMMKAIAAVNEGLSFRQAGDRYGVPWPTLYRKLRLNERVDAKSGPPTVLEDHQENEIVEWLKYKAERGYPASKLDVLDAVEMYVKDLNVENPFTQCKPGRHWYEAFVRRHPDVPIGPIRTKILEQNTKTVKHLQEWFCKTKIYLRDNDLLEIDSSRIFNSDEMSIELCPSMVSESSAVDADAKNESEKSVKTLFMYSADGTQAPPLLMYKYKNHMPQKVIDNCPRHWGIGLSESGGIVSKTYFEYMTNVFYPWLLNQKIKFPIVLYLDKHASHVSIPLVIFCKEKNIELIALPSNFTQVIQPLNIALFRPFKDAWSKAVVLWKVQNNAKRLNEEQFPIVLRMTLDSLEEKTFIPEGFKVAGLVPFDPNAINYNQLRKRKYKTAKNPEGTDGQSLISSELFQEKLHLQAFESNIPRELLNKFERCQAAETWTGDVEKRGMFEYWLKIKKAASGNEIDNTPIVESNGTINDSVILFEENFHEDMDFVFSS